MVKCRKIVRRQIRDNISKDIKVVNKMENLVLRTYTIWIMAFWRQYDVTLCVKHLFQIRKYVWFVNIIYGRKTTVGRKHRPASLEIKVSAIMIQTDYIRLLVLPHPIMACQLTEMRILIRDIIPRVIPSEPRDCIM